MIERPVPFDAGSKFFKLVPCAFDRDQTALGMRARVSNRMPTDTTSYLEIQRLVRLHLSPGPEALEPKGIFGRSYRGRLKGTNRLEHIPFLLRAVAVCQRQTPFVCIAPLTRSCESGPVCF